VTDEHVISVDTGESYRLDIFLSRAFGEISRTKLKAWCHDGLVKVNGKPRKGSFLVRQGDQVRLQIPQEPRLDHIEPENLPLDVVYQDSEIAVINKVAGMVVHPGAGVFSGTLVHALAYHMDSLSGLGGAIRPGIVHRLDKGTSGLILVAKTDSAHANLSQQWQDRLVTKVYQALVWGHPEPDNGTVTTHIGRSPRDPKRMAAEVSGGKVAVSRYKTVEAFHEAARVNVHILTGRTHQIRVHMAHLGFPVVGDGLYGGKTHKGLVDRFNEMPEFPMLHAGLLRFRHPGDCSIQTFKLDPPEKFSVCARALAGFPYEFS